MTLTRRGRHTAAYAPPAEVQEISEEEPPTLVDAKWADREHDVKAIVSAYLAELAQYRPF